jgi:hypothetical protein
MRYVICHYHIYKNSGTSFDALLTENFKNQHICFDGPFPFFTIDQEQLTRIIDRKKNIIAFSSHQIQLPTPVSPDYTVLPVVFIRHPLLRILSIYRFKRKNDDGTKTSKNAQIMDFDKWIELCFHDAQEITHISNAQTRLLGSEFRQRPLMRRSKDMIEYDLDQAKHNIQSVELLARTEYFNTDVKRFSGILKKYNITFNVVNFDPKNTTNRNHKESQDVRLGEVEQLLSNKNYQRIINANIQDLNLYEYTTKLIYENG